MARMKKRCESTLDLFVDSGTICGEDRTSLVAGERRKFAVRPLEELRNSETALKFHHWRNTPEEEARLIVLQELLHERRSGLEPDQEKEQRRIRRIAGTGLVAVRRRPKR